jgi:ABC-type nitrate/sulfonate/bicarbonate transport system substrate-binding protein
VLCASLSVLALVGTGCGGSDEGGATNGEGTAGPSSTQGGSVPSLTVALASPAADVLNRIASEKGYFKDEGVDVALEENTAANTPTLVASGKVDLAVYSTGGPASLSLQGQDVSIIYGLTDGSQAGYVIVSTDAGAPARLEDLRDVDNCVIATQAVGTAAYGNAVKYNKDLDLGCQITPLQDATSQAGALASGRASAIVGSYSNFAQLIAAKKAKIILDTGDPAQREKYLGDNYLLSEVFGRTDKVKDKAAALTPYLKALDKARQYFLASSSDDLVDELAGMEAYKGLTKDAVKISLEEYRPHFQKASSTNGYVSKGQWDNTVQQLVTLGLPGFDASSPRLSYDQMVDMSYFITALGQPKQ